MRHHHTCTVAPHHDHGNYTALLNLAIGNPVRLNIEAGQLHLDTGREGGFQTHLPPGRYVFTTEARILTVLYWSRRGNGDDRAPWHYVLVSAWDAENFEEPESPSDPAEQGAEEMAAVLFGEPEDFAELEERWLELKTARSDAARLRGTGDRLAMLMRGALRLRWEQPAS